MIVSTERINQLSENLRSSDVNRRRVALAELEDNLEIVPAELLIPLLRDEDAAVRRQTVQLLEEIGDVAASTA